MFVPGSCSHLSKSFHPSRRLTLSFFLSLFFFFLNKEKKTLVYGRNVQLYHHQLAFPPTGFSNYHFPVIFSLYILLGFFLKVDVMFFCKSLTYSFRFYFTHNSFRSTSLAHIRYSSELLSHYLFHMM